MPHNRRPPGSPARSPSSFHSQGNHVLRHLHLRQEAIRRRIPPPGPDHRRSREIAARLPGRGDLGERGQRAGVERLLLGVTGKPAGADPASRAPAGQGGAGELARWVQGGDFAGRAYLRGRADRSPAGAGCGGPSSVGAIKATSDVRVWCAKAVEHACGRARSGEAARSRRRHFRKCRKPAGPLSK